MRLFSVSKNKDLSLKNKKTGLVRKVLVVSGLMMALFMVAPVANNSLIDNVVGVETSYAAELPYSHRWETQSDGSWKYKMDDGSYATNKWLQDEVDLNWYLMDDNGIMKSGLYKSYGKYYILSEVHDGHYGHLVKNGEVYHGITIKASTNADDEGALTQETITALKSAGFNFDSVQDVSGTSHVTDGQISYDANTTQSQQSNTTSQQATTSYKNENGQGWNADGTFDWGDFGASQHITVGKITQEMAEDFVKNRK